MKFQLSLPPAVLPHWKETWIISAMIIASNADRAMTVKEWDPVLQHRGGCTLIDIRTHPFNLETPEGMVPVGPCSLTVTALSTGECFFASSQLKFQPRSWVPG